MWNQTTDPPTKIGNLNLFEHDFDGHDSCVVLRLPVQGES